MAGVIAIFVTLPILDMKEWASGLAVAVLVDATIVRAVLPPAAMKLLGDWSWYRPRSLERLPPLDGGVRELARGQLEPVLEDDQRATNRCRLGMSRPLNRGFATLSVDSAGAPGVSG